MIYYMSKSKALIAEKRLSTKNVKTYSDAEVRGLSADESLTLDENDGWE